MYKMFSSKSFSKDAVREVLAWPWNRQQYSRMKRSKTISVNGPNNCLDNISSELKLSADQI